MFAQTLHLASFRFAHRRIVPDHIPGHEGLFGTTSTLGLLVALLFPFRCNQWLHLRPKVPLPTGYDRFGAPWSFCEKPAQPTQTERLAYLTQHSAQRASSIAFHQPQ